ncbi:MAG: 3-oxoacyl-ACP reductase FabG [Zetaproteobacteria bacterium]|nr:3-oxoacyl-ACP reductase FabG [Zetaproteobacteria bacterium]
MAQEKVALVTGASRGIGKAVAARLAADGHQVVVHYRSHLAEAEETLAACEGRGVILQADLSEENAPAELVAAVKKKFGRLDTLVSNAGMSVDQLLPFIKEESFDRLIDVNVKPSFLLAKACSKMMIKQKGGSIINMTSVVGHMGNMGQSIYAATKAALTGFTKSIAFDLARYNIRANCVAPGFIETDMTSALPEQVQEAILAKIPLGRLGSTAEVAAAVSFLASEHSSYITGSTLHVNGGMMTS